MEKNRDKLNVTLLTGVTSTKTVKKDGEYYVKAYNVFGQRVPAADYFTNDKQDAETTAALMIALSN